MPGKYRTSLAGKAIKPRTRAIVDAKVFRLSPAAQEKFASLLLDPPPPSSGLQSAVERHRRLIRDVR